MLRHGAALLRCAHQRKPNLLFHEKPVGTGLPPFTNASAKVCSSCLASPPLRQAFGHCENCALVLRIEIGLQIGLVFLLAIVTSSGVSTKIFWSIAASRRAVSQEPSEEATPKSAILQRDATVSPAD